MSKPISDEIRDACLPAIEDVVTLMTLRNRVILEASHIVTPIVLQLLEDTYEEDEA